MYIVALRFTTPPDGKVLMCGMTLATLSAAFSQVVWNMNISTVSEYALSCHT